MARIVVVEDNKFFRQTVRQILGDQHEVIDCMTPEMLSAIPDPESITHALVDLSFGLFNHRSRTRRPNGLDAMVMLGDLAPSCERAAMSVLSEGAYLEIARAVHQFWPGTPILGKLDPEHFEAMIERFANGGPTVSHPAGLRATHSIKTMPEWATLLPVLMHPGGVGNPYELVEALGSFPEEPSNADLADRLAVKKSGIASRLAELRGRFEGWLSDPEFQKGARLWHWVSPRVPVFRHVRPNDY